MFKEKSNSFLHVTNPYPPKKVLKVPGAILITLCRI